MALASPAFAALKWAPGANGAVRVCFQPIGWDVVSTQQARLSALAWGQASTNLKVSFANCAAGTVVVQMRYGTLPASALGDTQRNWNGTAQGGILTAANITFDARQINAWNVPRANAWRGVTCHEMGHALGLEHTTATDSCMETNISSPALLPGAADKALLIKWYGGTKPAPLAAAPVAPVARATTTRAPIDLFATPQSSNAPQTLNRRAATHPSWGVVAEDLLQPPSAAATAPVALAPVITPRTAGVPKAVAPPRKMNFDTLGPNNAAASAAWRLNLLKSAK